MESKPKLMIVMIVPKYDDFQISHILKKAHAWSYISALHWMIYDSKPCSYWRDMILSANPEASVIVAGLTEEFAGNLAQQQWDWLGSVGVKGC